MTRKSLAEVAQRMRDIDIAMLSTKTQSGEIASRPMSNNSDVDYNGDSYFFTLASSQMVADIAADDHVSLAFSVEPGLFSGGGFFIAVTGKAQLVRDKAVFAAHWTPDLDAWFERGIDTPGLVMLHVRAVHIKYWAGEEEGEVDLAA
ncbi:pyridoxamine 5'-phosphate oxidase family protein [Hyphomicrobium sp. NDB2Meth4]|uniref:pyridoxamine 5'-phosphate oxidase family protein n=1 Tax=Hyphomicrobium sp. NDB2Meth4 TaxID=1892846 RepID=UPI0009300895|nr:pyridoxamine 5'-phosphate oxidase family protein [Hyphomicrobium sp. NDB2Meth4]